VTKTRVLLLTLGVVTLLAAAWLLSARRQPQVVALPEASEVAEVTALLYEFENFGRAVSEFPLPREYVAPVLAALRPAEREEYPYLWDEWWPLGRLRIRCHDGRLIEVTWPFSGKNPLCFQVDGKRCWRGGDYMPTSVFATAEREEGMWSPECTLLAGIVREAYQERVSGEKSSRAQGYFEDLERSAGRLPPHRR
jgi:hypothetical protein